MYNQVWFLIARKSHEPVEFREGFSEMLRSYNFQGEDSAISIGIFILQFPIKLLYFYIPLSKYGIQTALAFFCIIPLQFKLTSTSNIIINSVWYGWNETKPEKLG